MNVSDIRKMRKRYAIWPRGESWLLLRPLGYFFFDISDSRQIDIEFNREKYVHTSNHGEFALPVYMIGLFGFHGIVTPEIFDFISYNYISHLLFRHGLIKMLNFLADC